MPRTRSSRGDRASSAATRRTSREIGVEAVDSDAVKSSVCRRHALVGRRVRLAGPCDEPRQRRTGFELAERHRRKRSLSHRPGARTGRCSQARRAPCSHRDPRCTRRRARRRARERTILSGRRPLRSPLRPGPERMRGARRRTTGWRPRGPAPRSRNPWPPSSGRALRNPGSLPGPPCPAAGGRAALIECGSKISAAWSLSWYRCDPRTSIISTN